MFCDLGTPSERWNVYDELRAQLTRRGLAREAVRFVHEAGNDKAKADLFAACRSGTVAVLVASTERAGVGTNIQDRALALHHLDCPWRPADLAQREGRVLRQGNQNPQVQVLRYVTEGSFDTYTWQTVERKARFIGQLMRGRLDVREVEDVGEAALSYAEVKALAAGDPRLVEQAEVSTEVARLERLERAWRRDQERLRSEGARLGRRAGSLGAELSEAQAALARRTSTAGEAFRMVVGGWEHDKRSDAGLALAEQLRSAAERLWPGREVDLAGIAVLGGFEVNAKAWCSRDARGADLELAGVPRSDLRVQGPELGPGRASQLVARLEGRLRRLDGLGDVIGSELAETERERAKVDAARSKPFAHDEALSVLRDRARELDQAIAGLAGLRPPADQAGPGPSPGAPPGQGPASLAAVLAASFPAEVSTVPVPPEPQRRPFIDAGAEPAPGFER